MENGPYIFCDILDFKVITIDRNNQLKYLFILDFKVTEKKLARIEHTQVYDVVCDSIIKLF